MPLWFYKSQESSLKIKNKFKDYCLLIGTISNNYFKKSIILKCKEKEISFTKWHQKNKKNLSTHFNKFEATFLEMEFFFLGKVSFIFSLACKFDVQGPKGIMVIFVTFSKTNENDIFKWRSGVVLVPLSGRGVLRT